MSSTTRSISDPGPTLFYDLNSDAINPNDSSRCSKTRKSKQKIDFENFTNTIKNENENESKKKWTVKIACEPYLEAARLVYPEKNQSPFWSAKKSFKDWSQNECLRASTDLICRGIPLKEAWIKQVYQLLQLHQDELIKDHHSYPALFRAKAYYVKWKKSGVKKIKNKTKFELLIYSVKKVNAVFRTKKEAFIADGNNKVVYKIFSLGVPQVGAYCEAKNCDSIRSIKAAANEEHFLTRLQGESYAPEIYDIFYYSHGQNNLQQIIVMKHYKSELYHLLEKLVTSQKYLLTDQEKILLTCKLLKTIANLHKKNVIHRDIKPENIMLDGNEIKLIDFGFTCEGKDEVALQDQIGSILYVAPEILFETHHKSKGELDVWSMGCVIWILWFEKFYPWSEEVVSETRNEVALKLMSQFSALSPSKNSSLYPFFRMLDFNHQTRCSAAEAHILFNEMGLTLSQKSKYALQRKIKEDLKILAQERNPDLEFTKKLLGLPKS
jgi:serine/threonine protein kinase